MPKRVIDFDAMWGSDKLASCAEWAQAEYAWLYGLADASGCFELTNLRVIWGRVAAIRRNLTIERLEQIFDEFQVKGLLFVWEHEGKRYGHWSGSDVPGRLPAPSWRMRLERLAPPVPKRQFAEYMSRFARGRAALAGGGFRGEAGEQFESSNLKFENSESGAKRGFRPRVERQEISNITNLKFENSQNQQDRDDCCGDKPGKRPESSDLTFENSQNQANRDSRPRRERGENSDISHLKFEIPSAKQSSVRESGLRAFQPDSALRRLKDGVEEAQAQDWNSDEELSGKKEVDWVCQRAACGEAAEQQAQNHQNLLLDLNSNAQFNPVVGRGAEQRTRNHQNLL